MNYLLQELHELFEPNTFLVLCDSHFSLLPEVFPVKLVRETVAACEWCEEEEES